MNIRPYILLNGVDSRTKTGLLITELPPISKPLVRTLVETVDGRDGDLITPLGFNAYDKPCKIGLANNYDIDSIISFFNSEGVVTFSNEPTKFYRYAIYNQIDFERLIRFRTAEVVFHVQPFKFSTTEAEITKNIQAFTPFSFHITNNGNYYSTPKITITASGVVTVTLNTEQILSIDFGSTQQTVIIDPEEFNAYYSDNTLANRIVTGNYDKIRLRTGQNSFYITGAVITMKFLNYSRWL